MVYQLPREGEGIKVIIWAAGGFFTLGFTAVIVLGFTFKSILFFYSTDEKLEQIMKLTLNIIDSKRIIKWVLCKICRIKISIVKCFF